VPLQRAAFDTMFGLSRYQGIPAKFSPPEAATGRDSGQPARASQPARQRQASPSTASQPASQRQASHAPTLRLGASQAQPQPAASQPEPAASQSPPGPYAYAHAHARVGGTPTGPYARTRAQGARASQPGPARAQQPARASPSTAAGQASPSTAAGQASPSQRQPAMPRFGRPRPRIGRQRQPGPARACPGSKGWSCRRGTVVKRDRKTNNGNQIE